SSDEEVKRPRKKRAPQPMFPAAKRGQGHLSVVVSAIIDEEGRPTEPVIVEADGEFSLVCATLEALWKWEFEPATYKGEPVPVYYNLVTNFRSYR
ncbi:MAG: energy transducer TonB, partial [Acidobacteriota bacterium]